MVINTQEVLPQQPKTKNTMQPILDLLIRLVVALELIAAKFGNGAAPVAVTTVESETETETKPAADKPKATRTKAVKEEAPKVDFEALRAECKASITALVESADEKLPDIKADLAKLEEEDLS